MSDPSQPDQAQSELLNDYLRGVFQSPDYRPPVLPQVAVDLLRMTESEITHVGQMVKVLEDDAMIAGRVLQLVQTPVYAGRVPIRSLQQAVVRLGMTTLRNVVMEVAVNVRVFRATGYQNLMKHLQRHSRSTAHIARVVSRYTGLDGEFAFLCGLMHDVGIAGLIIAISERHQRGKRPALVNLWPAIELVHEAATGLMAQLWDLPEEIYQVLRNHHQITGNADVDPVVATLQISEFLANELGAGIGPKAIGGEIHPIDGNDWPQLHRSVKLLGLTQRNLQSLREDTAGLVKLL